jgi:hypothetical protein
VSEIANACAHIPGSVDLDKEKRKRALELLRRAILAGEFDDAKKRSKVADLHPSPAAELRFARDSADIADDFFAEKLAEHLWIRRADCKAFYHDRAVVVTVAIMQIFETAPTPERRAALEAYLRDELADVPAPQR